MINQYLAFGVLILFIFGINFILKHIWFFSFLFIALIAWIVWNSIKRKKYAEIEIIENKKAAEIQENESQKYSNERLQTLTRRYGTQTAYLIINKFFWKGETQDQLIESIGRPESIDVKVLKTKKKEIWKYKATKNNQFMLKITLENGRVVAWDEKFY